MPEIERIEYGVDSTRSGYSVKAPPRGQRNHLLTLKWKAEMTSVGNRIDNFIAKYCCPHQEVSVIEQKTTPMLISRVEIGKLIPSDVRSKLQRTYQVI